MFLDRTLGIHPPIFGTVKRKVRRRRPHGRHLDRYRVLQILSEQAGIKMFTDAGIAHVRDEIHVLFGHTRVVVLEGRGRAAGV